MRHALGVIAAAPIAAAVVGSAFNIWYNVTQIEPLLSAGQEVLFGRLVMIYNAVAYPVLSGLWLAAVFSMRPVWRKLLRGEAVEANPLRRVRVRAVNLPWHGAAVLALGFLLCVPVFLIGLGQSPTAVDVRIFAHLPVSFVVAALITTTQGFFLVELLSQRLLFPVLFTDERPARLPGAYALSLKRRLTIAAIASCVCPIVSLLLLGLVEEPGRDLTWFMVSVGVLGIAFGLFCSWLVGRLVTRPVEALRRAAQRVAAGDLEVSIDLVRADEFGPLIDEFNRMVAEMRAKRELRERFGLHVGRRAAEIILAEDPGLSGRQRDISVMFCDIRNFTARSADSCPDEIVHMLNRFLTVMVEVVERRHGGMVNKYLGDGFMALFGMTGEDSEASCAGHACSAVAAGRDMVRRLDQLNRELTREGETPLGIGIGINSGPAVVGSIGSLDRLEFTAIGDTVNVASRVEGLTKAVGSPLLFTHATRRRLPDGWAVIELEPQMVKGQTRPIEIFTLQDLQSEAASVSSDGHVRNVREAAVRASK
ncbi:MAG: HAMP domain-containing protein [Planctomycetes bacterium]|nr:HAMP domain-containing protein [Planctomycetota bacterium]